MIGRSYGAPLTEALVHNTGVNTARGADGVGAAHSVCDCGWRGSWRHGEDAGVRATADSDEHRSHVGWVTLIVTPVTS